MSAWQMTAALAVIGAVIVAGFVVVWWRDARRAHEQALDPDRRSPDQGSDPSS
jgi:hypothetical protein